MPSEREILITKRTDSGLTQREFAARLGVSQPFLAAFESGSKQWPQQRIDQAHSELDEYTQPPTHEERETFRDDMRAILDGIREADQ